jgi:hypothetical protein
VEDEKDFEDELFLAEDEKAPEVAPPSPVMIEGEDKEARKKGDFQRAALTWALALYRDPTKERPEAAAQSPEDEKANRQSAENKRRMQERDFNAPFWPTSRALAWIAYRRVEKLDRGWQLGIIYDRASMAERDPRFVLLRALQQGKVTAIRDGVKLSKVDWARVEQLKIPDVDFDSAEILALWPAEPPNLEQLLEEAIAEKREPLTQREAEEIASDHGAKENQKEVREVLTRIQGKQKPGPRGPRNKKA